MAEATMNMRIEIVRPDDERSQILGVFVGSRAGEEKPGQIRVLFRDGTTEIYDMRAKLPAPQIEESIRIIRRMKQGYVNQPARRRGRR